MASVNDIIGRVRTELGDPVQPFRTSALCDGFTTWFDLPKQQIIPGSESVDVISGASTTVMFSTTLATAWSSTTSYTTGQYVTYNNTYFQAAQASTNQVPPASGSNSYWTNVNASAYTMDYQLGQLQLVVAPVDQATVIVSGSAWAMFSDADITVYVQDAVNEHCLNRTIEERHWDANGYRVIRETPVNLSNLPAIEEPLVAMLATIHALWTLANDASTDASIQTAEGTVIDRATRYQQVMNQINAMTDRYQEFCGQLNVGVFRMETLQLRRVSQTTGRLVPVYRPREFDDPRWPGRQLTPVDHRDDDNSGIPSPVWSIYGP